MKLKDLKTAYNVLCEIDYPVPTELMVHMAQTIRVTETTNTERKIARMSEEQLIRMHGKQKRHLRIFTADGRLIEKRTAEATFREAIRTIGPERMADMGLRIGRRVVILRDETLARKRIHNYYLIRPGFFLIASSTSAEKRRILKAVDERLQLNWEIELV